MIVSYNDNMNKNDDCLFCKIIDKKIPAYIVYEDNNFLGFLDIKPVVKGHSLLIPKEHYEWIHETPDEIIAKAFIIVKKLIIKMRKSLSCDYVQVVVVGKDVPHFHIHLIPRRLNDNLPQYKTSSYQTDEEQIKISSKIKNI